MSHHPALLFGMFWVFAFLREWEEIAMMMLSSIIVIGQSRISKDCVEGLGGCMLSPETTPFSRGSQQNDEAKSQRNQQKASEGSFLDS